MSLEPTPAKVLTKGQMKRAARESKVRTKNVLYNPFRLEWPPVERDACAAVLAAVDAQFQRFDIVTAVPQSEYTALLAAGDRAAITARRQQVRAAAEPLLAARRHHLAHCVLGFNAASRALEAGRLAALLVEADTPALETRYLLPLAAGRRCPAACVPRLRAALQRRLGVSAAVLGLLPEAATAGHHLRPLYDAVCAAASPLIPRRADPPDLTSATTDRDTDITAPETTETPDTPAAKRPAPAPAAVQPPSPAPSPAPSPEPFQQADFISLSAPEDPLMDLISIDTAGVPHKKRLRLKQAPVMSITLGSKALKRAAKAAQKAGAKR